MVKLEAELLESREKEKSYTDSLESLHAQLAHLEQENEILKKQSKRSERQGNMDSLYDLICLVQESPIKRNMSRLTDDDFTSNDSLSTGPRIQIGLQQRESLEAAIQLLWNENTRLKLQHGYHNHNILLGDSLGERDRLSSTRDLSDLFRIQKSVRDLKLESKIVTLSPSIAHKKWKRKCEQPAEQFKSQMDQLSHLLNGSELPLIDFNVSHAKVVVA